MQQTFVLHTQKKHSKSRQEGGKKATKKRQKGGKKAAKKDGKKFGKKIHQKSTLPLAQHTC